jgi:aspartyl-tRNA(Asn)/glutamyl-tRNA(Gln) amidotransferase subunit C
MPYNPDYFKNLAKQIRFNLSDEEALDIANEFEVLLDQMRLLEKIDTENVTEMVYPFEVETSFMREDEVTNVLPIDQVLLNAPSSQNGFFVTKKVIPS